MIDDKSREFLNKRLRLMEPDAPLAELLLETAGEEIPFPDPAGVKDPAYIDIIWDDERQQPNIVPRSRSTN